MSIAETGINTSTPTIYCVLCKVALADKNETQEHAIPQAIGGRIKSKKIICKNCNNLAGSKIDKYLTEAYFPVVSNLSEFMPAASDVIRKRSVRAIISYETKEYASKIPLDPEQRGSVCYASNPNGEKLLYNFGASEPESTLEAAHKIEGARPGSRRFEKMPPKPLVMELYNVHFPQSTGVRCAALKAGLLALAALGAERYGVDFTSPIFDTVRQTIELANEARGADGDTVKCPTIPRSRIGVHLGLRPELLPELKRLRQLSDFPITDFEHFIVLSGNAATQALELFVILFAAHVFAFRLTNDWANGNIVLLAVNGILKDSYSNLERLDVTPLPVHGKLILKSGDNSNHDKGIGQLCASALAYRVRYSKQFQRSIICGRAEPLYMAVMSILNEICPNADVDQKVADDIDKYVKALCARVEKEAANANNVSSNDQTANIIAQAIEYLARLGIFPVSYLNSEGGPQPGTART